MPGRLLGRHTMQGVLSPLDAALAVDHGVDGIIVSNHGGRQLDTVVTAVDVLPQIAAVINKRVPILVDGGIQRGSDIVKVGLRHARLTATCIAS